MMMMMMIFILFTVATHAKTERSSCFITGVTLLALLFRQQHAFCSRYLCSTEFET